MYQTKISETGISRKETPDNVYTLTYRSLFPTISHVRIFCMQSHNLATKQLNNKIPSWIPRITVYITTAPREANNVFLVSTIESRPFNRHRQYCLGGACCYCTKLRQRRVLRQIRPRISLRNAHL